MKKEKKDCRCGTHYIAEHFRMSHDMNDFDVRRDSNCICFVDVVVYADC